MKRMSFGSKFLSFLLSIAILIVFFAGCGVENAPNPTEATEQIPAEIEISTDKPQTNPADFCEKPGENEGFIHSHPLGTTVRYDLNGDGIGEDVSVDAREYDEGTLTVGNAKITYQTVSPTGYFTIVNVDRHGDELLIGISDYGFSDDPITVLYAYDGVDIREVGYYEDITGSNQWKLSGAVCNSDGTITAKTRVDILGTWEAWSIYRMESGILVDVTDFYEYVAREEQPNGWEVTTKTDVIMFADTRNTSTQTVIPAGTKLVMTGIQKGDRVGTYWVCFKTESLEDNLWMAAELVEWHTYVPTEDGLISSEEAFDGFYYAG